MLCRNEISQLKKDNAIHSYTLLKYTRQIPLRPKTQGYGLIISIFSVMRIRFWNEYI